jgi:hypothetical protein
MIQEVWLVHPEEAMCVAFRKRFSGLPNVRVIRGRLEDLEPHDCFVTAGNAFGIMTAGIDAAVLRYHFDDLAAVHPSLRMRSSSAGLSQPRPRGRRSPRTPS